MYAMWRYAFKIQTNQGLSQGSVLYILNQLVNKKQVNSQVRLNI